MTSTCVLVLGITRSGTSLIAGILHHLGVMMVEDNFVLKSRYNQTGYYEDNEFVTMHCNIVETNKTDWIFDTRKHVLDDGAIEIYHDAINRREKKYPLWGLKDSRLLYFLEYFLSGLNCHLKVVVPIRNKDAVINSNYKYLIDDGFNYSEGDVADAYVRHIELQANAVGMLFNSGAQIIKIHYEALLNRPFIEVSKLANFVGRPINDNAIGFVKPSLNHHKEVLSI